ncbi:MAG: radical SAM family heme chaperone HemW [Planctomycetia bacterium]|nr:radical SAM family heme chaperone HemW [Planctomycetia bacterium]
MKPVDLTTASNAATHFAEPRAAYIHVPFCAHRCGYCNFTLVAGRDELIEPYLAAIAKELSWLETPRPVDTLFIGGGTPTHLPPRELDRLLALARQWFPLSDGYEFSVEANPIDIDGKRVAVLAAAGVTRVSLGAQSFRLEKLRLLERDHTAEVIQTAVDLLRPAVRSLSLDLIFGAPGETLDDWQAELAAALRLRPDHVSTYGLTFERGTTFYSRRSHGSIQQLGEDVERTMYEYAIDTLTSTGFEHYEVSNFARPNHHCRHNKVYWNADSYFAAGPGAARYVNGVRETNHRSTLAYLKRIEQGASPVAESETLDPEDRAREALVLGLRRLDGVPQEEFAARFEFTVEELGGASLTTHLKHGLLEIQDDRLQLTREGLLVSDALWGEYLRR